MLHTQAISASCLFASAPLITLTANGQLCGFTPVFVTTTMSIMLASQICRTVALCSDNLRVTTKNKHQFITITVLMMFHVLVLI